MNRDDLEKRLRAPHPLERSYSAYRGRGQERPVARPSFIAGFGTAWLPLLLVAAGLAVVLRVASSDGVGAVPQPSIAPAATPEPTKPFVSLAPESPPAAISVAPCGRGSVAASLAGRGGAMGTQYALIRIVPLHGRCSLPLAPSVVLDDGSGSAIATSEPSTEKGRIALETAVNARVGVSSLCSSSPSPSVVIVVDLGDGNVLRVPMRPGFSQGCNGGSSQVSIDDLFVAP